VNSQVGVVSYININHGVEENELQLDHRQCRNR